MTFTIFIVLYIIGGMATGAYAWQTHREPNSALFFEALVVIIVAVLWPIVVANIITHRFDKWFIEKKWKDKRNKK